MKTVLKMTARTIRSFKGRYMAILLIVALSSGFFAGLKITTDAMLNTGSEYFEEQNFYDFRIFSTLGFTENDVKKFGEIKGVKTAEGTYSLDALMARKNNNQPFKLYAISDKINIPSLSAGKMPEADNECLADEDKFTEEDIGKTISLSEENDDRVTGSLERKEFIITGLVSSPLHIGLDRGTTDIGNGSVYSFLYLPEENFKGDVYTEIDLLLSDSAEIYSSEYDELIDKHEENVTALCEQLAEEHYEDILKENNLTEELAKKNGIKPPKTYVLTRNENTGYVSFKNDTGIIGGVANIFPVFFIMISVLVCVTTMTRMVDEERTQIGVLKAMGYGSTAIIAKYLLYAGSAALIGWTFGFFSCTWALPQIFWFAYSTIYGFAPMSYLFSPGLAVITLAISLLFILGSTFISCRNELTCVPASLIRPRAAKSGKRVALEHITPVWRRLSFLQKITIRNMFRYKQRLFMMLIGIGCCAGLVVTAFGVRDSMIDIGELQYTKIQNYDIEASFDAGTESEICKTLDEMTGIEKYITISLRHADVSAESSVNSVNLISIKNDCDISDFWDFHNRKEALSLPEKGEVLISPKIAERLSLSAGDVFEIRNSDMVSGTVKVSEIFDNYIYDYVVMSEETYTEIFEEYRSNTALIKSDGSISKLAGKLTGTDRFSSIADLDNRRRNISDALSCLNYIIWMIIFFSGALAFTVVFNLTNINIAERSREIATVQVLGFYPKETETYVLKENLVLSVIASIIGLPLGKLFHITVMSMVKIDMITFNNYISPLSYLMAFVCTVLFAVIVNKFMKRRIDKINMTESLKAVE
ncbi:MAG: FtsX-like permease family protein [Oscillospiraceae bacterium]|nr:FtsX-like permease family protein [Oscillospiraceae bacterium]